MEKSPFPRRFAGLALALLFLALLPAPTTARAPVEARLWEQIELHGRTQVVVVLQEQADLEGARFLPTSATFQLPASGYPTRIPDRATPNNGLYALATGLVTMQYLTVSNPLGIVVGVENAAGTEATAYQGPVHGGLAVSYAPAFGTPPYEQGPGTLAGRVVVSGTGVPIPSAVVTALDPYGQDLTTTTDLAGDYALPLCADFYTVTAAAAGYTSSAPLRTIVFSASTTQHDFALEPFPAACDPVQGASFTWEPPYPPVGAQVTFLYLPLITK